MRVELGRAMLAMVVAAIGFGGAACVARADDAGVKAAIKAQDRVLNRGEKQSPLITALLHNKLRPNQWSQARRQCVAFAVTVDHAGAVVAKPTPLTPAGAAGQKDWVAGVRELSHAYRQLATALTDALHHRGSAASREARTAEKTITAGNKLGYKADHELGLTRGA
jgi:hypothetical protein